ncbi:PqiC family protein [Wenzhouxiangella sp. XN24]|uniref:PqiC family protein n=1 Tax=Wenzhouxiangella sp. XN24 TaxID=2713569 RepID=UPI0013EDFD40|nr:PqiC family protein [Wenzhouxiangella sp. XN24]NGX16497.1 membrane integrity-associated transporter subunit PqiC [Wenzhouxiangella sp. XN24]
MFHPKHPGRFGALALLGILLLGGCIPASPPMRFFVLTPIEAEAPSPPVLDGLRVLIGPLRAAGYLDRPQLMTRRSDGELMLHELDRWAAPLDEMLVQTLADNLMRLTGSEQVLAYPTPGRAAADLRVTGQIIRFDTDTAGVAVLKAQWQLKNGRGEVLMAPQTAEYRARAENEGMAARVGALSTVVGEFARELAVHLAEESGKGTAIP